MLDTKGDKILDQIAALLDRMDEFIEQTNQVLHPKRIPLEIFAIAASGSQNKVVTGTIRNRKANNKAVNSAGGWQRVFTGFDDEQPFVMNMSAVAVSINFDGETPETDNNAILLPSGTMFVYPGLILPVSAWVLTGGAQQFVGIIDDNSNLVADVIALADAIANGNNGILADAFGFGFNGVTWDRLRTLAAANAGSSPANAGLGVLQQTPMPATVLAVAVQTGAATTATAAAPGAGLSNYVTGYLIIVEDVGVAAAAGTFDITTTNLPGNQLTIPVGISAAVGQEFIDMMMNLPNPLKVAANTATTITGTPPANVRMAVAIFGFIAP